MIPTRSLMNRSRAALAGVLSAALLAACGGGGGDPGVPLTCSATDQKLWLESYLDDWYFWYRVSPRPSTGSYASVADYFAARLYTGSDPDFPAADRWSHSTPTTEYQRFYGEGRTLGFGVMVAGLEVKGHPEWPLYVRYIEPGSPAATAGLVRGDEVLLVNGRSVADLITADDFSAFSANAAGDLLTLRVRGLDNQVRDVTVTAAVYALVPVTNASTVRSVGGRLVGYVAVKDMVSQAESPFDTAFAQFRSAGVQDVVIDLRYNGGGLVSAARTLASYPSASSTAGQVYTRLLYNDRQAGRNEEISFRNPSAALGLSRVYVLTGQRTCSASEQLINALRPYVQVVTVGDTTCGKPVGFLPQDDGCGNTWSVVNFESVNALNQGRYFDGFDATCAVAEDYAQPLGSTAEPLLATALWHADTGSCGAVQAARSGRVKALALRPLAERSHRVEPGDRQGMVLR
jgi:hypothetical protein